MEASAATQQERTEEQGVNQAQVTGVDEKDIAFDQSDVDIETEGKSPEEARAETEDVVEILRPKKAPKKWTFSDEGLEREYIQRPLSFVRKMQWFSLVGEVLDRAMSGENSLTVNNLLSAPTSRSGDLSMADFRDADTFVHAVGKLLIYAPDFLLRSYCIWLNVPDYDQDIAIGLMARPEEEGGLSDDQGLEIIEIFIDQNYEALDRFFRDKIGQLQKRVQQRAQEARESQP